MDEHDLSQARSASSSPRDQFEHNFSCLGLGQNYSSIPVHYPTLQPFGPNAFGRPTHAPNTIPSTIQISDHINDLINKNESIVGRINRRGQKSGNQARKRSLRGPWRYEERILQLGYKPSHQRRNSLPVQTIPELQRPYKPKNHFKRRASLPVIQASTSENMTDRISNSVIRESSPPRAIRTSVIMINPAHRPNNPENERSKSFDDLNGNDSDGSELIIVDDENFDEKFTEAALLKESVASNDVLETESDGGQNQARAKSSNSSVIKITPGSQQQSVIQNPRYVPRPQKRLKTDAGSEARSADVPANVLSVVEEVKRKALLTVQQSANPAVAVVSPFRPESSKPEPVLPTPRIVSVPEDGGAPNAVIHNPVRVSGPASNPELGEPLDSDDEDTRPFKCHECQKGFRISGHLARHIKAEIHMKRMQELRDLGINPTNIGTLGIQSQPLGSPVAPVISDFTVSSTTIDPPRSQTPESEEGDTETGGRRFPCATCNVAFRFQGHLDRHYRSTMHQSMVEAMEGRVTSSLKSTPQTTDI